MQKENSTILDGSTELIPCGYACEALSFLQQIYHSAPIGMMAVDTELQIVRLNERLADFVGKNIDDCPGLALEKFIPQLSKELGSLVQRVFQSAVAEIDSEFSFTNSSGEHYWTVSAYPVNYEAARSKAVNLIIHDISEAVNSKKRLEKALQEVSSLQEQLKQENQQLRSEMGRDSSAARIVGNSHSLLTVMHQIKKVAPTDATVLITGDTGTGKELAAREIHRLSRRAAQPIIIVNCAAMPANLIESELFGHEKGSFTGAINKKIGRFEVASGGTIFLDEIGEMPLELQSKLLRVLQESQLERIGSTKQINIDVRVIAATNRNLKNEVENGRFREDLFFRLNVFPVHLPSLSERGHDVIAIAEDFMQQCARKQGKHIKKLTESACNSLMAYSWPGNIRELRNVIERAVILCQTDTLEIEFPGNTSLKRQTATAKTSNNFKSLNDVAKSHILEVLNATSWRIRGNGGAAEILGIKPTTLESRMSKLGIKRNTNG